jgi:hypothetical protein
MMELASGGIYNYPLSRSIGSSQGRLHLPPSGWGEWSVSGSHKRCDE